MMMISWAAYCVEGEKDERGTTESNTITFDCRSWEIVMMMRPPSERENAFRIVNQELAASTYILQVEKKGEGVQVKQQVSERYRKELERTRESERERVGEIEKGEEVQKRKKKLISCTPYNHLRAESKETEIRPPRPRDHSSHHISAPASYCMRTILTAKCHKKKKKRKFWFGNRPKQQQQQPPKKMIIIRECVGFCFLIYSSRYTSGPMVGRFAGSILFLRLLL